MIVPEYWAEAKVTDKIAGSQITIKRFGWSDVSEEDAKLNAQQRANEVMVRARAGEKVRKVDHKLVYNGAEGLPIREEIVERHGNIVITRNTYGALCLNTPDVLFADIDFQNEPSSKLSVYLFLALLVTSAALGGWYASWMLFIGLGLFSIIFAPTISYLVFKFRVKIGCGPEKVTKSTIEKFAARNPDCHLRVYRTPMGYRVLAMHKTYDPNGEDTVRFLKDLNSDPVYVQMCKNQHCFRARISPKPWRIGLERLGPRPGVWPIKKERMPARNRWVAHYTSQAKKFASCRFEGSYGSSLVDARAEFVRAIHDEYCKADTGCQIA